MTRAVKRRFGVASRPVAVRAHVPWHWRGLLMLAALSVGIGLAWWMYDISSQLAGFDRGAADRELARMQERINELEQENRHLKVNQVKIDRSSLIDSAAQQDLERALKSMQEENAQLKEELAFLRGMTAGKQTAGVNISRFQVDREAEGKYRYQLLLVQTGQASRVFKGRLQLLVTTQHDGRKEVTTIPARPLTGDGFNVTLNSYQKLEGSFQLAPASEVISVEARIFGEGASQPAQSKTVNLS